MASIDWPKVARNLSRKDVALFHPVMPGIASSGVSEWLTSSFAISSLRVVYGHAGLVRGLRMCAITVRKNAEICFVNPLVDACCI